ncbi:MAG TPA: prenyltransferase/squalene oxidase repeat-containing protein [Acidimicrobiales bacterium]|nr:prenyltransferase/squalene oxidase repeat-containing protein [Acidimicrobiales bacterium]
MTDTGLLTPDEAAATAAWIASVQLPTGMIPWFPGGHADPWNHVEAAMALVVGGQRQAAEAAYRWLADTQLPDGSWCLYHLAEGIEEPRRDPNVCAYVAAGLYWHLLETGDRRLLGELWPVVDRALDFVCTLQRPDGAVAWSLDVDGTVGSMALLTGCSSILHSLRCGVALAGEVGQARPEWELAAGRLRSALARRPEAFAPKHRWAMDWYYPVLGGALDRDVAVERLRAGWDRFVMPGVGVRCVDDHPWVTVAETAEAVMALDAAGLDAQAAALFEVTRHFRCPDGAYHTGCVHPQCVRYPGGERSTYSAAAVVMAAHVLGRRGPASTLFHDDALPVPVQLEELADLDADRA